MDNEKTIGESLPCNTNQMSEEMKKAEVAYHKIFDKMPKDKRIIIYQMFGAWGFTQCAVEAYESVRRKDYDDAQKILAVGTWADMSLRQLKNVMLLLNKDIEGTLKTIDETSDWITSQGWHGLPSVMDQSGACSYKTAHGLYLDMLRFSETRNEYVKQSQAEESRLKIRR